MLLQGLHGTINVLIDLAGSNVARMHAYGTPCVELMADHETLFLSSNPSELDDPHSGGS